MFTLVTDGTSLGDVPGGCLSLLFRSSLVSYVLWHVSPGESALLFIPSIDACVVYEAGPTMGTWVLTASSS